MMPKIISLATQRFGAPGFLCLVALAYGPLHALADQPAAPTALSVVRAELLRDGWLPRETFGAFPDGLRWNADGDAGALYKAGFMEVEACSATGAHYCRFNYVRGVKCLTLQTQGSFEAGRHEPTVVRRSAICPKSDIMSPPGATPSR